MVCNALKGGAARLVLASTMAGAGVPCVLSRADGKMKWVGTFQSDFNGMMESQEATPTGSVQAVPKIAC